MQKKERKSAKLLKGLVKKTSHVHDAIAQESRREGWTDARLAVGFCLGSGLFGSYNSD